MPSEFELIAKYFLPATRHTVLAGGDDAALLEVSAGMQLVVSTDMLVQGTHFLAGSDPQRLGHKALAVNLSDLAAMGAKPRWVTLSLALPSADETWLASFARGFLDLAGEFDVDLVGGDTTRGPLNICVQIMGEVETGKALRRDGAHAGDAVWVSGTLGDAALALRLLHNGTAMTANDETYLRARLETPTPRVRLGRELLGMASAAIDVSDGLAADLAHICERSKVGAEIELSRLPRSEAFARKLGMLDGAALQLAGGDDYDLCFCAPVARAEQLRELAETLDVRLTRIGRIVAGSRVVVVNDRGAEIELKKPGFDHFA